MKPINELPVPMTAGETTWGLRYWMFQLVFLPPLLQLSASVLFPALPAGALNFIYYLTNLIALLWIFRAFLDGSIAYTKSHLLKTALTAAVGFAVFEVINISLGYLIGWLMPEFFNINDAAISATGKDNLMLTAIGTVVLVPISEELMYRGLLFGMFRRRSRILGYAISIVCFCSIHVMGYVGSFEPLHIFICFLQYIPAGLILAASYDISGSIFAPVAIHTAINAIGVLSLR